MAKKRKMRMRQCVCPRCTNIYVGRSAEGQNGPFALEKCPDCKSGKPKEPSAKTKKQPKQNPPFGAKVFHAQGQTRKVGGNRSSS